MSYICLDNGTVWPHPRPMTEDPETSLEWRLRHSHAPLTRQQRMAVADVLHAYDALITHPGRTEQDVARIVGEIREKLEESNSRRRRNNGATEVYEMPDQATRPMWYVCELNRYNVPNWQNADGPHDSREECEETIALMNRLNCLQKKERVICEVRIYEGKEAPDEGLNHDAINTLNTCVEAQQ